MTKWYQFLNRIRFPSPTKALVYRVRAFVLIVTTNLTHAIYLLGVVGSSDLNAM